MLKWMDFDILVSQTIYEKQKDFIWTQEDISTKNQICFSISGTFYAMTMIGDWYIFFYIHQRNYRKCSMSNCNLNSFGSYETIFRDTNLKDEWSYQCEIYFIDWKNIVCFLRVVIFSCVNMAFSNIINRCYNTQLNRKCHYFYYIS